MRFSPQQVGIRRSPRKELVIDYVDESNGKRRRRVIPIRTPLGEKSPENCLKAMEAASGSNRRLLLTLDSSQLLRVLTAALKPSSLLDQALPTTLSPPAPSRENPASVPVEDVIEFSDDNDGEESVLEEVVEEFTDDVVAEVDDELSSDGGLVLGGADSDEEGDSSFLSDDDGGLVLIDDDDSDDAF